ncbi:uncharacterized protein PHALS_12734 [Plasmopara halstedii]|uniref:Uncharacterized protein n=1 Tax=Plasmopara halstedii TaxID=4781 RepID=A0A0N7L5U6_PLAHL|nr:uncharacterized protein PHALS_12734 [Plasmopara halstedii]CEG42459.1 hypothetical protein PHALS_12734 [Plasmopara halstedii]|eukprot:XP_024578828.1 hypothetical protein PHALS_12734 [Plasmopara halstedii]
MMLFESPGCGKSLCQLDNRLVYRGKSGKQSDALDLVETWQYGGPTNGPDRNGPLTYISVRRYHQQARLAYVLRG